jgi:hypothetical protein
MLLEHFTLFDDKNTIKHRHIINYESDRNDRRKSVDLSRRQKIEIDGECLTSDGKEFQARAMLGHQLMSGALKEREAPEHPQTVYVNVRRHQPPDKKSRRDTLQQYHEGSDRQARATETGFSSGPSASGVRGGME